MFKRLSSALLTAITLGSPVAANELKDYIYSNPVLAEVHRSGTTDVQVVSSFKDACYENN